MSIQRPARLALTLIALLLVASFASSQYPPDLGGVTEPADEALGQVVPPTLNTTYDALGQNITREDVRMFLELNITRAYLGIPGLLLGSGNMEIDATIHLRVELRAISTERIQQALIGNNPYNVSADNSTFLTHVYLPAEVFRATLAAEAIALFQAEQEQALQAFIEESVPELEVVKLDIAWSNVFITQALTDFSLTEPPIVVAIESTLKLHRVESIPSLLREYLGISSTPGDSKVALAKDLKEGSGDTLAARDFFAAAAYTQLLNLSMQPGWSLDVTMRVPRGFTFEYFNENVEVSDDRQTASFRIDAAEEDGSVDTVVLASLTQRRVVAATLFAAFWVVASLFGGGFRAFYAKRRVPSLLKPLAPKPDAIQSGGDGAEPPSVGRGGEPTAASGPKGVPSSRRKKSSD